MAKSFGGALKEGVPIVMKFAASAHEKNRTTEIWYRLGDEKNALELLEKMDVVKRVIMPEGKQNDR